MTATAVRGEGVGVSGLVIIVPRLFFPWRKKARNWVPRFLTFCNSAQGFRKYIKFGHWNLGSGEKKRLNKVKKLRKKSLKSFFAAAILHPLFAKDIKSENTSYHYFSSRIPKIKKVWTLDFGKWGQKDRLTR